MPVFFRYTLWLNRLLLVCCTETSEKGKVPSSSIFIVNLIFTCCLLIYSINSFSIFRPYGHMINVSTHLYQHLDFILLLTRESLHSTFGKVAYTKAHMRIKLRKPAGVLPMPLPDKQNLRICYTNIFLKPFPSKTCRVYSGYVYCGNGKNHTFERCSTNVSFALTAKSCIKRPPAM